MGILEDIKNAADSASKAVSSATSTAKSIISGFGVGGGGIDFKALNQAGNEANSVSGGGIETTGPSNINDDYSKTTACYRISLTKVNTTEEDIIPEEQSEILDEITDFHYLAFIRNPITKQATYIDMQAMIPTATLISIETAISNNNFPQYELQIKLMSEIESTEDSGSSTEQELIYSGFVVIISSESQKDASVTGRYNTGTDASIPTRLVLVNPIAYEMSVGNDFNVQFEPDVDINPTLIALETIINNSINPELEVTTIYSFADFVTQKAANEKDVKHIVFADKSKVNLSNYRKITIPSTIKDIWVPEYIISSYKPFSTPSFWFFDTFNFANYYDEEEPENGRIPIWCFLICFYNAYEVFEKFDLSDYREDVNNFTHLLSTAPFNDEFKILKPNARVIFTNTEKMTCEVKDLGEIPNMTMTDNTSLKAKKRSNFMHVPFKEDTVEEGMTRILDGFSMFTEHIQQVEYYETTNTTPDWLQFGKLYNLEKDKETGINKNDYLHTPICIINIFKRRQTKDNTMECINKYAMIRLITPPEESEGESE